MFEMSLSYFFCITHKSHHHQYYISGVNDVSVYHISCFLVQSSFYLCKIKSMIWKVVLYRIHAWFPSLGISGVNGVSVSAKSNLNVPFTSTPCAITPQPRSSNHSPSNKTSSSHEGWVKGKYASTHLISTPSPHRCSTIPTRVCLRLYSTNFTASNVCMACFSGVWFLSSPKISSGSFKTGKRL